MILQNKLRNSIFLLLSSFSLNTAFATPLLHYQMAIVQAAMHQPDVSKTPLKNLEGPRTRMLAFTTYTGYKKTDTALGATVWVTAEPEVKDLCARYLRENNNKLTHEALSLWIAQLLGLPETNADKRQFVVLDVPVIQAYYGSSSNNRGIFRPCTDPRIEMHPDASPACPAQMDPLDTNISSEYKTWFINNSISAYVFKTGAPWTEYGYTYNWNPSASNVYGVSEFVILKSTEITVLPNPTDPTTAYMTPEQYCV